MQATNIQQTSETSKSTKEQVGFQLQREEAETLVRYWHDAAEMYEHEQEEALVFADGISGGQVTGYMVAWDRLDRLSDLLGKDMATAIVKAHTERKKQEQEEQRKTQNMLRQIYSRFPGIIPNESVADNCFHCFRNHPDPVLSAVVFYAEQFLEDLYGYRKVINSDRREEIARQIAGEWPLLVAQWAGGAQTTRPPVTPELCHTTREYIRTSRGANLWSSSKF